MPLVFHFNLWASCSRSQRAMLGLLLLFPNLRQLPFCLRERLSGLG